MSKITVKMLQLPQVLLDGQPVTFPFKRVDALFYLMLCRRTATRRELVSLLWEDCEPEVGYKNLRHALYVMKKCLGQELLLSPQKATLQLNPQADLSSDYADFTQKGDLSAYNGPFLQDFSVKNAPAFDIWLTELRERLERQYLQGLSRAAATAAQEGDLETALNYAVAALQADPLDERMAVFLMQLYGRLGQYPKAAQVYQQLRQDFADELGIAPLNETAALYYQIMDEWNGTAAAASPPGDVLSLPGREPLLQELLAQLRGFLSSRSPASSLLLSGEEGSGKTTLLESFLSRLDRERVTVISAACFQSDSGVNYSLWQEVMEQLAAMQPEGGLSIPGYLAEALAAFFPPAARLRPPQPGRETTLPPPVAEALEALFSALRERQGRKLLLVVEDVQWIDEASLGLLDLLLRRLGRGSLMLVLTCGEPVPQRVRSFISRAEQDKLLRLLRLPCLSREQTGQYLCRAMGAQVGEEAVDNIFGCTGGNPALLAEVVKAARESGSAATLRLDYSHILDQRMRGLSLQARQLADMISLFLGPAPCAVLADISGREAAELSLASDELRERGLISEERSPAGGALCFTHPQIRELIYCRQSWFRRKPLHLRVARLLEQSALQPDAALCAQLVHHFSQAGETRAAFEYDVLRQDIIASRWLELLPTLTAAGETIPPEATQLEADLARLETQLAAFAQEPAAGALDGQKLRLMFCRGRLLLFDGEYEAGMELLEQLAGLAARGCDLRMGLRCSRVIASYALQRYDLPRAERWVNYSSQQQEKLGDMAETAAYYRLRGACFAARNDYDKSSYYLTEAEEAFARLPDSDRYVLQQAAIRNRLGELERRRHGFAAACVQYKKSVALAGRSAALSGKLTCYTDYGRAALQLEDEARSRELFAQAYALGERTGELGGRAVAAAFDGLMLARGGNYTAAAQRLVAARALADRLNSPLDRGLVCYVEARLRSMPELETAAAQPLADLLPQPLEEYCRQGLRLLQGVHDGFEIDDLNRILRFAINKQNPYTVSQLYSKNKLMTE